MNKLEKLIRANEARRTRFHTARGELLPLRAVPDAVRSAARRAGIGEADQTPWLVPSAIAALAEALDPAASRVLELGSGSSTLWFARRAAAVTAWEADSKWASQVRAQLAREGLEHVAVRDLPIDDTPAALAAEEPESFDVVVVDCLETPRTKRLDLVGPGARLVRPGGLLVLDDSDRQSLWPAEAVLAGWPPARHVGIKPFPLMAVETTLFRRPLVTAAPGAPAARR